MKSPVLGHTVFTKNFSDHKPTGPVNHENPQAQVLFCWPEKKQKFYKFGGEFLFVILLSLFFFYYFKHYLFLQPHTLWMHKFMDNVKSDVYIINKKRMCHQTFQRPSKSFGTSLSDDSGLRFSKTWRYLRLQIFLSREGKIVNLHLKNN